MTDQPTESPRDPSPEVLAELARLNEAASVDPNNMEPMIALWKAVARLDYWVFVNRGTPESPIPYMVSGQDGPIMCIYSNAKQAQSAAHANGVIPTDEPVPLFGVPLPEALDWAMSFGEYGVTGVVIDYPYLGAWSPLPNLQHLKPA